MTGTDSAATNYETPAAAGALMRAEIAEGWPVFLANAAATLHLPARAREARAIHTIARGSSDAVATAFAYEAMRETGLPVTSLPPSVFSLGRGVRLDGTMALIVSQSGASADLAAAARGARDSGAFTLALTNIDGSEVERASDLRLAVNAGEERAVPATKTVLGSLGTGLALTAALATGFAPRLSATLERLSDTAPALPDPAALARRIAGAERLYVVGRDTGYGAAQELALKIKECCAIHAEAYSASEVLHGPLQLATRPMQVLILDTGHAPAAESLDTAEARFAAAGCPVTRIAAPGGLVPLAASAALLAMTYPAVLEAALALGANPDRPATLSKITRTV